MLGGAVDENILKLTKISRVWESKGLVNTLIRCKNTANIWLSNQLATTNIGVRLGGKCTNMAMFSHMDFHSHD